MVNRTQAKLPPKILRYDIFLSSQAPALAVMQIQTEAGMLRFLCNKQTLEALGKGCLTTAAKLQKTSDLN
jgi:hypothetical protein